MLYVRYVHLTKAKRSILIREIHKDYGRKGSVAKNLGRDPLKAISAKMN
jgi:hypothetical protein